VVHEEPASSNSPAPRPGSVVLRLVWMTAIPVVFFCILLVADRERWAFGRLDLALGLLVVAALVARAADALWLGGTTARGEPAGRSHVLGYAARLVSLAGGGWILAQSVQL
jgi:hypothetical protein